MIAISPTANHAITFQYGIDFVRELAKHNINAYGFLLHEKVLENAIRKGFVNDEDAAKLDLLNQIPEELRSKIVIPLTKAEEEWGSNPFPFRQAELALIALNAKLFPDSKPDLYPEPLAFFQHLIEDAICCPLPPIDQRGENDTPKDMTPAEHIYQKMEALHQKALRTGDTYSESLTSGDHQFYVRAIYRECPLEKGRELCLVISQHTPERTWLPYQALLNLLTRNPICRRLCVESAITKLNNPNDPACLLNESGICRTVGMIEVPHEHSKNRADFWLIQGFQPPAPKEKTNPLPWALAGLGATAALILGINHQRQT